MRSWSSKQRRKALYHAFELSLDETDVGLVVLREHGKKFRVPRGIVLLIDMHHVEIATGGAAVTDALFDFVVMKFDIVAATQEWGKLRHSTICVTHRFSLYKAVRKYLLAEAAARRLFPFEIGFTRCVAKVSHCILQPTPRKTAMFQRYSGCIIQLLV